MKRKPLIERQYRELVEFLYEFSDWDFSGNEDPEWIQIMKLWECESND